MQSIDNTVIAFVIFILRNAPSLTTCQFMGQENGLPAPVKDQLSMFMARRYLASFISCSCLSFPNPIQILIN